MLNHKASSTASLVGLLLVCLDDAHSLVIDGHCCTTTEQVGPLILKFDRAISAADESTARDLLAYRNNLAHEYGVCEKVACTDETFMDQLTCYNHTEIPEAHA
jgi:hypothetical protein